MFSDYYAFVRFTSRLESLNVTIRDLKVRPYNDTRTPPVHLIKFTINTDRRRGTNLQRLIARKRTNVTCSNNTPRLTRSSTARFRGPARHGPASWKPMEKLSIVRSANDAKIVLNEPVTASCWSGVLSIPSLGAFNAKVAWSTPKGSNEIGLTFEDPSATVVLVLAEALPRNRAKWIG